MFCNFRIVLLFVFSSISAVHSEYQKTVIFNIEVDSKALLSCAANPVVRLVQGDKLEILAYAPSVVRYMWCNDKYGNRPVDRCTYDLEKNQCSGVTDNLKAFEGYWTCEYLLERNDTSIRSTTFRDQIEYNYAKCNVLIYVQGTLWFSGLDPNRRSIKALGHQVDYVYRYKLGELLNIGCEQDGNRPTIFKIHDSQQQINGSTWDESFDKHIDSPFKREATSDLDWSLLSCTFEDYGDTTPGIYDIKLSLRPDSCDLLSFAGLDYSRLTTVAFDGATDYTYKYKLNEDLKVGCSSCGSLDLEKSFLFIDVNSFSKINTIPLVFEAPSATSSLNGSSLICSLKNSTRRVYSVHLDFVLDSADTTDTQLSDVHAHKTEPAMASTVASGPQTLGAQDKTSELFAIASTANASDGSKFNWNSLIIATAVLVSLCVIALCAVLIWRRKKTRVIKELPSKYESLKENAPVPLENEYKGIDHYLDEAVYSYADLNRVRLDLGSEGTYAEPSHSKNELLVYALPYSKTQQELKKQIDLNYTNVFGKDYVNSKRKGKN